MSVYDVQHEGSDMPDEISSLLHEASPKRQNTPLKKLQISILMLIQMAEPIASMSIYPYINQLIRELDVTGGNDAKVGYYAGIMESLFFIAEALTVLGWSRLSDRVGRKPVLMVGLFGIGLSILCFGLSTSFWTLVVSFIVGGVLARPQDHWPKLFPGRFWEKYRYFLPCVVAASIVFLSFMLAFLLKETLSTKRNSKHYRSSDTTSHETEEFTSDENEGSPQESTDNVPLRSLLIPSIIIPLTNQAFLAFLDICLFALMPLFYSTPNYLGGLGFTPTEIGSWMALFGVVDSLFQALFFAKIVDRLGPKRTFYIGVSCFIPIMIIFPVMSWFVASRGVDYMVKIALFCQLVLTACWDISLGSIFMYITASAPANNVLGAINGMGQMSISIAHAVGPMTAASIFAFSKDHNILGGHAAFIILCVPAVGMLWLASHLPEELHHRDGEE